MSQPVYKCDTSARTERISDIGQGSSGNQLPAENVWRTRKFQGFANSMALTAGQ
jgi:hypothetical protein